MIKSRIFLAALFIVLSTEAKALTWDDVWLNPNEKGYKALKQNDLQQAAKEFNSPAWQGVAYYRLKEYQKALVAFSKGTDATAFYNKGNALALLGRYPEAILAYNKALSLNAAFDDARFNRDLLKKLAQTTPPFKQRFNQNQNSNSTQNAANTANDKNATNTNTPQNNSLPPLQPPQQPQPQSQGEPSQNPSQEESQTPSQRQPQPDSTQQPAASYQDQQQQQALQNISDDPGGLLQRKLQRDYQQSLQQGN